MVATPPTIGAPVLGTNRLLFALLGADMNSVADQALAKAFSFTSYVITSILFTNASTSPSLAVGGIYPTTSKGGTAIISAATVYSGMTASTKTLSPALTNTDLLSAALLYLSLTIAQGGAATADVRVFGYALS